MSSLYRLCSLPLAVLVLSVIVLVVGMASRLSPAELWSALSSAETIFALRLTLITSALATGVAFLLGVPAAYFLARRRFPGRGVIDTILDLPLVMPPLVAGVGLLLLLGDTPLGRALNAAGIRIIFTPAGAVAAQAFVASFFVVRGAKIAFEAIDPDYEAVALSLGANPYQVFWEVTLPLAGRGLISAVTLGWARAMGEFGATLMVAGATPFRTETMPVAVFLNISSGEIGVALACALVLLAAGFCLLGLLRWLVLGGREKIY